MTHVFKHPKFYRIPRDKTDQVISPEAHDGERERAPGPGLKQQAASDSQVVNQVKLSSQSQAASAKLQAPSDSSFKPQASSAKTPDPGKSFTAPEPRCWTIINVLVGYFT